MHSTAIASVSCSWQGVRLEFIGSCVVVCTVLLAVFLRGSDALTAGMVGLSISFALSVKLKEGLDTPEVVARKRTVLFR